MLEKNDDKENGSIIKSVVVSSGVIIEGVTS